VDDSLAVLTHWSGTHADVMWRLVVEVDLDELRRTRALQKMALARYARQSLLQWAEVEVTEIAGWYSTLKEVLDNEGAVQGEMEDR
jgi:hypothetical protein